MLSLEDCVALCGLTDDEVQLVADHEHVPTIVATELASELMKSRRGIYRLKGMMLDELERAKLTNHRDRARQIDDVYLAFNARFPTSRVL